MRRSLAKRIGVVIIMSIISSFVEEFGEDDDQFQSTAIGSASRPKKKRSQPGNPDPDAEVVALSPRTLMATNRYICEVCHKGFQRDQNLQLHRRGHNLPWKLKQRPSTQAKKRVYICPEINCVHHNPSRALGDLTGIKKHFCRKHGEKKWKCDKCSKRYAVQSDWKAHAKICGSREYRCDCGTIFSRKDSFVTHRAFCDALSEESYRAKQNQPQGLFSSSAAMDSSSISASQDHNNANNFDPFHSSTPLSSPPLALASAYTSATALLQKAAEMGSKTSDTTSLSPILLRGFTGYFTATTNKPPQQQATSSATNFEAMGRGGDIGEMGLYDLPVYMNSSGDTSSGLVLRDQEKMTVDFLGVAPPGFPNTRNIHDHMHSQW